MHIYILLKDYYVAAFCNSVHSFFLSYVVLLVIVVTVLCVLYWSTACVWKVTI